MSDRRATVHLSLSAEMTANVQPSSALSPFNKSVNCGANELVPLTAEITPCYTSICPFWQIKDSDDSLNM